MMPSSAPSPSLINSFFIFPILFFLCLNRSQATLTRCSANVQCADPNSKCVRVINSFLEYCECFPGFKYEAFAFPYCLRTIPVGQPCNNSFECKNSDPNSVCSFTTRQICECEPEYSLNLVTKKCRRPGQSVGQTKRPQPRRSTTVSTTPPTNSTKKPEHDRRSCSRTANCTDPEAKCVYEPHSTFGFCKCENGYRPGPVNDLYCIRAVPFGGNCSSSKECRLSDPFTTCSSNPRTCECLLDHVFNKDTGKCDLNPSDLIAAIILLVPVLVLFFVTMSLCVISIKPSASELKNRSENPPQTPAPDPSSQTNSNQTTDMPFGTTNPSSWTFSDDFDRTINQVLSHVTFAPSAPPIPDDRPPTYEATVYGASNLINLV